MNPISTFLYTQIINTASNLRGQPDVNQENVAKIYDAAVEGLTLKPQHCIETRDAEFREPCEFMDKAFEQPAPEVFQNTVNFDKQMNPPVMDPVQPAPEPTVAPEPVVIPEPVVQPVPEPAPVPVEQSTFSAVEPEPVPSVFGQPDPVPEPLPVSGFGPESAPVNQTFDNGFIFGEPASVNPVAAEEPVFGAKTEPDEEYTYTYNDYQSDLKMVHSIEELNGNDGSIDLSGLLDLIRQYEEQHNITDGYYANVLNASGVSASEPAPFSYTPEPVENVKPEPESKSVTVHYDDIETSMVTAKIEDDYRGQHSLIVDGCPCNTAEGATVPSIYWVNLDGAKHIFATAKNETGSNIFRINTDYGIQTIYGRRIPDANDNYELAVMTTNIVEILDKQVAPHKPNSITGIDMSTDTADIKVYPFPRLKQAVIICKDGEWTDMYYTDNGQIICSEPDVTINPDVTSMQFNWGQNYVTITRGGRSYE